MSRTPLVLVAILLLIASACSGSSTVNAESTEAAVAPTTAVETANAAPATRAEALAFCEASAQLQDSLAALARADDFGAEFQVAIERYDAWARVIPAELALDAAPVIEGWAEVVGAFSEAQDRQATMGALVALLERPDYQASVAAFTEFGNQSCVPDTTIDESASGAADDAPTPAPTEVPVVEEPDDATPGGYTGTGGFATVAGIELVAEQCDFVAGDVIGADEPDHFASIAVGGFDVFLAGQVGDVETGLMKFVQADEPNCSLVPDTGFGTAGVLELGESINHVSGAQNGAVAASNVIFGTWLVNANGQAAACERGSFAEISPDGQVGFGFFPGLNKLGRHDFTAGCSYEADAVAVESQPNPSAAGWVSDDLFVIGGFLADGGAGVTALDRAGNERWTVGGSPGDLGDLGYGAISAVSGCGGNVCVVDSNFRTMHVLDAATGSQLGIVDLQELTGLRINWFNSLAEEPASGTLWLTGGLRQLDPGGSTSDRVQGLVYRITLR